MDADDGEDMDAYDLDELPPEAYVQFDPAYERHEWNVGVLARNQYNGFLNHFRDEHVPRLQQQAERHATLAAQDDAPYDVAAAQEAARELVTETVTDYFDDYRDLLDDWEDAMNGLVRTVHVHADDANAFEVASSIHNEMLQGARQEDAFTRGIRTAQDTLAEYELDDEAVVEQIACVEQEFAATRRKQDEAYQLEAPSPGAIDAAVNA